MKKVYVYKIFERFWHWSQAILIFILLITGFEIHSSFNLIGFKLAVNVHNSAAWAFLVLIVFAIFWHLTTNEFKQYVPTLTNMKAQINYYLVGIFANAPHPTKKRTLSKLNPLQRVTYFALKIVLIPVMVVTGLLFMYFNYPDIPVEMANLELIALIHTLGAYLVLTFLIIHLYLITTGHTISSNLKAMVTGWDMVEDAEVYDIMEEIIDETGKRIKPLEDTETGHEETKEILIKALKETEVKLKEEELEGQKYLHKH